MQSSLLECKTEYISVIYEANYIIQCIHILYDFDIR